MTLLPAEETFGTHNNGVVGWLRIGKHPNTGDTDDTDKPVLRKLVSNAITEAAKYVDFAAFDTNSDKYVDTDELAVVIIAAGYEHSYAPDPATPNVHGHRFALEDADAPVVNGVKVGVYREGAGGYAMFGEVHDESWVPDEHMATLGIMVHELGHLIFKWPDLYDTDESSAGLGAYDVMSAGNWGRTGKTNLGVLEEWGGETPVLPSAYLKLISNWVDGAIGNGLDNFTKTVYIFAAGSEYVTHSNSVFRLTPGSTNDREYFLVENRQDQGYDKGLEEWLGEGFGGGLAIYHIDANQTDNRNDSHRLVNIETADNYQMTPKGHKGQNTNLWYKSNATTFNDASTPNSKLYDGRPSGVSVVDIGDTQTVMNATLSLTSSITSQTLSFKADFNRDKINDILSVDSSTGEINIWLLNYAGGVTKRKLVGVSSKGLSILGIGKFDNSDRNNILLMNPTNGDVIVWTLHEGDFSLYSEPLAKRNQNSIKISALPSSMRSKFYSLI